MMIDHNRSNDYDQIAEQVEKLNLLLGIIKSHSRIADDKARSIVHNSKADARMLFAELEAITRNWDTSKVETPDTRAAQRSYK